jgi:hypothetical protein
MYCSFFSPTVWMQSPEVWITMNINLCEHNIHYNSNFSPSMISHVDTMPCLVSSIFLAYVDLYLLCRISMMCSLCMSANVHPLCRRSPHFSLCPPTCLLSFVWTDVVVFSLVYCLPCVTFSGLCFRKHLWLRVCLYNLYEICSFCFPIQVDWAWYFLYVVYYWFWIRGCGLAVTA